LDVTGTTTLDSTLSVPLGSAAAPTVFFTGDSNTGIYSPGADQVAISTGGSGRLFIDSAGRISIGGSASSWNTFDRVFQNGNVSVAGLNGADNSMLASNLYYGDSPSDFRYVSSDTATLYRQTSGAHVFYSAASGTAGNAVTPSERLRITSAGLVGIGTSSPTATCQIEVAKNSSTAWAPNTIDDIYRAYNSNTSTNNSTAIYGAYCFYGDATFAGARFGAVATSAYSADYVVALRDVGTFSEKFRITSSGRVGIGTTNPQYKLAVIGDTAIDGTAYLTNGTQQAPGTISINYSADNSDGYIKAGSSAGVWSAVQVTGNWNGSASTGGKVAFHTAGTERARIDTSGRLLVGTSTSPSAGNGQYAPLVVQGFTGSPNGGGIFALQRGEGASTITTNEELGRVTFGDSAGNDFAYIGCFADANAGTNDYPGRLTFSTTADGASSPTERMRINADGGIRLISATTSFSWGPVGGNRWSISPNNTDFYIANNDFSKYAVLSGQNFTGWTFGSDARIKENIQDLEYGIEQLKSLKPRRFNFIGQDSSTIGFIAQEVRGVIPEAVTGEEIPYEETDTLQEKARKTLGITKDALIPLLTKALQEAIAKIETLEARLTAAGIE
jgi:hypothetical protein